jgi:hypothetical protein
MADNKPATLPTWATDANFSSGPKTGQPTKVAPSGGALAQGDVPGQPYRGERHNWLWNLLCSWIFYLSDLPNQTQFLNAPFTWTAQHLFNQTVLLDSTKYVNYSSQPLRTHDLDIHHTVSTDASRPISFTADAAAQFDSSGLQVFRIPFRVPVGATIGAVTAKFQRGSSNTVTMKLRARGKSGTGDSAVQIGSTQTDTGGSNVSLSLAGLSETALDTTWYWLEVTCSGTSGTDVCYRAQVTWADPGPRGQVV